ncbi:MAG TPA: type II secretion system protein GspG [Phycisphaerales bacterium]|nr:type II secretion system protein GspG [Phycisphaerales bacterium]
MNLRRHGALRRPARRPGRGFTLLEMMLVVLIIGLLATVVIVNLGGSVDETKRGTTISKMSQIKAELTKFQARSSRYPADLGELVPKQLEKLPKDGWNNEFIYFAPSDEAGRPFTLISKGADGIQNTADDINVWTMDEPQP